MGSKPQASLAAVLLLAFAGLGAAAQEKAREPSWPEVKCARYKAAYAQAIKRLTTRGLTEQFLSDHDAFLASNCTAQVAVCPRSKEELNLANALVIMGMNEGMASTFMPFACRK
jgi:hypothetical protein